MKKNSNNFAANPVGTQMARTESDIIKQVTTLHERLLDYAKKSLADAIKAGSLLTDLKRTRPHGKWLSFVENQLPFSARTATRYMTLFEHRDELHSKTDTLSDLTLNGVYRLLNKPREKILGTEGKSDILLHPAGKLDHDDAPCDSETRGGSVIDVDVEIVGHPATSSAVATAEVIPPVVAQESPAPATPPIQDTGGVGDAASAVPEGPKAPEPAEPPETGEAPSESDVAVCDERDFILADGTRIPFRDWFDGLLAEKAIRCQLAAIECTWAVSKKPEELEGAVLAQKLVVGWAAHLNRSLPSQPTDGLIAGLPAQVNAVLLELRRAIPAMEDASCRINNVIVTGPSFPRPHRAPSEEHPDEEQAA